MAGFSIDGLVSNLDTTAIIDAIIESESGMVNHLREQQTEVTQKSATYSSISAVMLALKANVASLMRRSSFDVYNLEVSNEDVLTATVGAGTAPGNFSLNVDALARNHQIASQGFADADTTSIGTGTVQISVGDGSTVTLTLDEGNDTLTGLKTAINDADLGVTASIVDDGTSQNAFRLVLTATESGKKNAINFTASLSGGQTPDFATAVFDTVETDGMSTESTAAISLGDTAAYSGNQNKTYTFTIGGSGVQTVGASTITVNWTDGTYSGSFQIDEADTEIALTGDGSDGLKLSFGAGDLKAGDTFDIQSFAPTLQVAADAKVSLGSTAGGGSPIVISSPTNQIQGLISGVTLNLKQVSTGPVDIAVSIDKSGIKSKIQVVLDSYNEVMQKIDEQFEYNEDTGEAGILLGDGYLLSMQSYLRSAASGALETLPQSMNMLASIGIRTGDNGQLSFADPLALDRALDNKFEMVKDLFTSSGVSSNPLIRVLSATVNTVTTSEGYLVEITQAATHGSVQGKEIYDPEIEALVIDSTNNNLKITIDGVTSEMITLTEKTYATAAELMTELQNKIDADENIGKYGATVEWFDNGDTGYIKLTSPSYGQTSQASYDLGVPNNAYQVLGMTNVQSINGENVEGTINGESATGIGRILTGDADNENTAGLKLVVNLTENDIDDEAAEATVTYSEGFAARFDRVLDAITRSSNGTITLRTKALDSQAEYFAKLVEDYTERLAIRRQNLYLQFYEMEQALSEMQSQLSYFTAQASEASSLWG